LPTEHNRPPPGRHTEGSRSRPPTPGSKNNGPRPLEVKHFRAADRCFGSVAGEGFEPSKLSRGIYRPTAARRWPAQTAHRGEVPHAFSTASRIQPTAVVTSRRGGERAATTRARGRPTHWRLPLNLGGGPADLGRSPRSTPFQPTTVPRGIGWSRSSSDQEWRRRGEQKFIRPTLEHFAQPCPGPSARPVSGRRIEMTSTIPSRPVKSSGLVVYSGSP